MNRKLFLQSLGETNKEYSKIRKDRRNSPHEFRWLFEGSNFLTEREKIRYEPPTPVEAKPEVTQQVNVAPNTDKDLGTFSRSDMDHNLKVLKKASEQYNNMVKTGEITRKQAVDYLDQLQKRAEGFISDKAYVEKIKALEQGADALGTVAVFGNPVLGGLAAIGSNEARKALYQKDPDYAAAYGDLGAQGSLASNYRDASTQAAYDAAIGLAAGKLLPIATAKAAPVVKAIPVVGPALQAAKGAGSQALRATLGQKIASGVEAGLAKGVNPVGALAGGYRAYEGTKDSDMPWYSRAGVVAGSSIGAGYAASVGNQIPFLGKVIPDPTGELTRKLTGPIATLVSRTINPPREVEQKAVRQLLDTFGSMAHPGKGSGGGGSLVPRKIEIPEPTIPPELQVSVAPLKIQQPQQLTMTRPEVPGDLPVPSGQRVFIVEPPQQTANFPLIQPLRGSRAGAVERGIARDVNDALGQIDPVVLNDLLTPPAATKATPKQTAATTPSSKDIIEPTDVTTSVGDGGKVTVNVTRPAASRLAAAGLAALLAPNAVSPGGRALADVVSPPPMVARAPIEAPPGVSSRPIAKSTATAAETAPAVSSEVGTAPAVSSAKSTAAVYSPVKISSPTDSLRLAAMSVLSQAEPSSGVQKTSTQDSPSKTKSPPDDGAKPKAKDELKPSPLPPVPPPGADKDKVIPVSDAGLGTINRATGEFKGLDPSEYRKTLQKGEAGMGGGHTIAGQWTGTLIPTAIAGVGNITNAMRRGSQGGIPSALRFAESTEPETDNDKKLKGRIKTAVSNYLRSREGRDVTQKIKNLSKKG